MLNVLKKYWGFDSFRGIQEDIIHSILQKRDTLGLMPTGGGKSITFQVPTLCMDGLCLVITPLIALMKDQVQNLREKGIKALAVYSGMSRDEILTTLDNCIFGNYKFLYISPERLGTELFRMKVQKMNICLITVDESHCISQWGYDFRPAYLKIAEIRELLPEVPLLALTATATPEVVKDIQKQLLFPQENVFRMSFERKNLAYVVRKTENKPQELLHILQCTTGSAIVYVRNRKRTKEIAELLHTAGITAEFYHAGLDDAVKDQRQQRWKHGESRVMVATNAFGMGIDKPDVRLVIHVDCPDSIEAYFQEAGRAGRDGLKAYAVLLYNRHDESKLKKRISDTFPEKDYIRQVYEHLAYYYQIGVGSGYNHTFEFNMDKFCHNFNHFPIRVDSALKILQRAGYLEYTEEQENQARVMFTVSRNDLYRLENNSQNEDLIITALLRSYGGLFTDYNYVDESFLAQSTGLQPQQVYLTLKSLSQRHILHFIPQKKTPYIRYTQRREDKEFVQLMPEVYEKRKAQFEEHIKAMIGYATNDKICRSRQLLRYFGEVNDHNCGQCDVCLAHRSEGLVTEDRQTKAAALILQLLEDGKPHPITDIKSIELPVSELDAALDYLSDEEYIIRLEDGQIIRN